MPVPGIQSIRNVSIYHAFEAEEGTFTTTINSLPSTLADEVVIRAVNWLGEEINLNLYLLWTNLNNSIVASIPGRNGQTSSPGTRIMLNGVVPNQLTFSLMTPQPGGGEHDMPEIATTVNGDLCIHMDFITYKKTQ